MTRKSLVDATVIGIYLNQLTEERTHTKAACEKMQTDQVTLEAMGS